MGSKVLAGKFIDEYTESPLVFVKKSIAVKVQITSLENVNSCYFRTSMMLGYRKALIKITERCNLNCAHCFVSSNKNGQDIKLVDFETKLLPELIAANVKSVTLTGGEPFIHPNIINIIELLDSNKMSISICTNGFELNEKYIDKIFQYSNISVNISMDGFSESSHGKFRGMNGCFEKTRNTIEQLGSRGILKGILSTPNSLSSVEEYVELAKFAIKNGAKYLLMNPLAAMGRGEKNFSKFRMDDHVMVGIKSALSIFSKELEIVDIRFPNSNKPLAGCEAGNIFYVFTNGDVSVCPYLSFAAKTAKSKYSENEFIISNIFKKKGLRENLDLYNIYTAYKLGENDSCLQCSMNSRCGKGCPASIVANGGYLNEIDRDLCPMYYNK